MDYGHWGFNIEFEPNDWFGFIYKITEINTGREYIGKKQFFNTTRKIIKGKKNRKKVISESNWKTYTGSSEHLNLAITNNGKDNYKFDILSLHSSKGSLHYAEVEYQITHNVLRELLDDGITKKYYNRAVAGVKFIPPSQTADELRISISKIVTGDATVIKKMTREDYEEWLDTYHRGDNNPMYGKEPFNKNKSYEELYGIERATKIKKMLSEYTKQQHLSGKTKKVQHTTETKEKLRKINTGKHTGENNNMYGKPCYYKMDETQKQIWKDNISKATKGKTLSSDHVAAMKKNWDENPDRKAKCSKIRSELNKSLSDAHKNATRQSNIKRGYDKTKKTISNDLPLYTSIIQDINNNLTLKEISLKTQLSYQAVWRISKNIEYYTAIIKDITDGLE